MARRGEFLRTVLFGLFSIIAFLVILWFANMVAASVSSAIFNSIVYFFNLNVWVIVTISFLFLFAKLSDLFMLPVNLFAPFFRAVGAGILIVFIFKALDFLASVLGIAFPISSEQFASVIVPIIFVLAVIIFIVGYLRILAGEFKYRRKHRARKKEEKAPEKPDWSDVGHELRLMFNDLFKKIRKKLK